MGVDLLNIEGLKDLEHRRGLQASSRWAGRMLKG
jgi:hypothetical protein